MVKVSPSHAMQAQREWVFSATPQVLNPWKSPSTHCIGSFVGPKVWLARCGEEKISWPHWGLNP
jgi:hypothetical protein